jgi:hypothetical protein
MRETARLSILSFNERSARSTLYSREDTQPILQNSVQKASGLRNYMAHDDGSDYDDGVLIQPTRRMPEGNRF